MAKKVKGRFFTLDYKRNNKIRTFCAKLISESPNYVTIFDVNTGDELKMAKQSLTAVNCGKFKYKV